MGIKEDVLEILKKHKDGLTIPLVDIKYKIKHGRKLGQALNVYLHRLADKDLVEPFIPIRKIRRGNIMGYRATDKAWEEERKEKALENLKALYDIMDKKMSPDIYLNIDEEKTLEEIEKVIQ